MQNNYLVGALPNVVILLLSGKVVVIKPQLCPPEHKNLFRSLNDNWSEMGQCETRPVLLVFCIQQQSLWTDAAV